MPMVMIELLHVVGVGATGLWSHAGNINASARHDDIRSAILLRRITQPHGGLKLGRYRVFENSQSLHHVPLIASSGNSCERKKQGDDAHHESLICAGMANEFEGAKSRRRYPRATGPFEGLLEQPVLIYDLNVGGGFINSEQRPELGSRLPLKISLPQEGVIDVIVEVLYQHDHGFAVQFVDLDADAAGRITRTVDALVNRRPW